MPTDHEADELQALLREEYGASQLDEQFSADLIARLQAEASPPPSLTPPRSRRLAVRLAIVATVAAFVATVVWIANPRIRLTNHEVAALGKTDSKRLTRLADSEIEESIKDGEIDHLNSRAQSQTFSLSESLSARSESVSIASENQNENYADSLSQSRQRRLTQETNRTEKLSQTTRLSVPVKSIDEKESSIDERHPLDKLLEVAQKSRKQIESIVNYECIFSKRELVGKKTLKTTMKLKFREKPFSVYLKYLDLNAGREVIYVQGKNKDNLLVHEAGVKAILGTFSIPPGGSDAMAENRHPVTSIGLKNMLDTVIKQWELESGFGAVSTEMRPDSQSPNGEICTVYEAIHSKPFSEFKYHITRLWIENETGLAIGVQQLGFPGKDDKESPLVEEYFYSKLNLKVELTDADFDKNNSNYAFR